MSANEQEARRKSEADTGQAQCERREQMNSRPTGWFSLDDDGNWSGGSLAGGSQHVLTVAVLSEEAGRLMDEEDYDPFLLVEEDDGGNFIPVWVQLDIAMIARRIAAGESFDIKRAFFMETDAA